MSRIIGSINRYDTIVFPIFEILEYGLPCTRSDFLTKNSAGNPQQVRHKEEKETLSSATSDRDSHSLRAWAILPKRRAVGRGIVMLMMMITKDEKEGNGRTLKG